MRLPRDRANVADFVNFLWIATWVVGNGLARSAVWESQLAVNSFSTRVGQRGNVTWRRSSGGGLKAFAYFSGSSRRRGDKFAKTPRGQPGSV